jgi:hypothetical protein
MNKSFAALFVSALATFGWAVPMARSAPPPTSQASKRKIVALQVDVADLPEAERGVAPVVLRELRAMLERAGHVILDDSTEGAIVLRARLRRMEAGNRNYGIHLEFMDGARATPAMEWTECIFCTEARVLERLQEVESELLSAIDRQQSQASAESDTGDDTSGDPPPNGDGDGDGDVGPPPKIAPIGPMGGVGIGVAALGIGGVVWGALELSKGRVHDQDPDTLDLHRTGSDHTPRGKVSLGAGIGGVVVGGALLVTDLVLRSKRRKQPPMSTSVVVPFLSKDTIGLGWTGRF